MKFLKWLMVMGLATSTQASVLVYDPYPIGTTPTGYTSGASLSSAGNVGVQATQGSWTGNLAGSTSYFVSSSGLNYSGLATSGGSISSFASTTNRRAFSSTDLTSDTYFSFLLNFSDFDSSVLLGLSNAAGTIVSGVNIAAGGALSVRSNGSVSGTTFGLSTGVTYLVVGEWVNGATDTTNIWINPTTGGSQPATTLSFTAGNATGGVAQWFSFVNTTSSQIANYNFDEFRAGTTWADVTPVGVPEPGTIFLLGGSLSLLVSLRGCRFRRLCVRVLHG